MAQATVYPLYVENYNPEDSSNVKVFTFTVTLTDDNDTVLPDLDNAYSVFNIKRSYNDSVSLVSVDTVSNSITINHVTGELVLTLTNLDLTNIPSNREESEYVYDWDLVNNQNVFYRILKGTITFGGDV